MDNEKGHENEAFDGKLTSISSTNNGQLQSTVKLAGIEKAESNARPNWSNKTEFLMSCIATSVGLGNIWRFPFTAYENGGGAFLIPYIIVLIIIGRPIYYLEMIVGQFTSRSSVKMWEMSPGLKGISVGQIIGTIYIITYYCALIAMTLYYFFASFSTELPWSRCLESWGADCVDSLAVDHNVTHANGTKSDLLDGRAVSSSELYFLNTVLREQDISKGIGYPSLPLTCCLFVAWITIFLIIARGIKSSGKAAYFLALFPYVVMIALLIRAVTLEGSMKGIIFFLKPQWGELLNPKIWYAATTQLFFSLTAGMGTIIMFSSYNQFDHNIYRDAMIVTTLDTFTSLMAGVTIFGILGNLAHNLDIDDIGAVVKSGTGLAFISYPDAITKFEFLPQVFSLLFFFMLYVLGIGSVVALQSVLVTVICDTFTSLKFWKVAAVSCIIGFLTGLVYITQGGQWMLNLVDHFGGTLLIFTLGILELMGILWFYGVENVCIDVEFMTGRRVTFYWRFCWGFLAPVFMGIVFIYSMTTLKPLQYAGLDYPEEYIVAGWTMFAIGMFQFPLWAIWAFCHKSKVPFSEALKATFTPSKHWGPLDETRRAEWLKFKEEANQRREQIIRTENHPLWKQKLYILCGKY